MKPLYKLAILGVITALIVYACSPSNYSGKSALSKLENALGQKVNATHVSALGYGVKVGDSDTQYFKVKCDKLELQRLVKELDLKLDDYNKTGADTPEWLQMPEWPRSVYTRRGFSTIDYGSLVEMWYLDGYLYVKVIFWH